MRRRRRCGRRCTRATVGQMMADVPLGAFLSGGIDSSSIVALMAEASLQPVNSFSIGFENGTYNELPYARQIAALVQDQSSRADRCRRISRSCSRS